jgi:hypothetical protein
MKKIPVVLAATLAATLGFAASADAKPGNGHGGAAGRPKKAHVILTNTEADANAKGRIDVKYFPLNGDRAERSWIRLRTRRLEGGATYTLWMDDPSTDLDPTVVQVPDVSITMRPRGQVNFRIDTAEGGTLPFGSTLALLAGNAVELRDVNGVAVLTGVFPTLPQ